MTQNSTAARQLAALMHPRSITMASEMVERIDVAAHEAHMTRSEFVRAAIEEFLTVKS